MTRPSPSSQRALALAAASGDVVLDALAQLPPRGRPTQRQGDYRRAIDCLRAGPWRPSTGQRAPRALRRFRPARPCCPAPTLPGAMPSVGTFAEAMSACGRRRSRIAEAAASAPASLTTAWWGIGFSRSARATLAPGDSPCWNGPWASVRSVDILGRFPRRSRRPWGLANALVWAHRRGRAAAHPGAGTRDCHGKSQTESGDL